MCGIAGIAAPYDDALLARLAELNEHRGPDEAGCHRAPEVGLVSRRLAIIDLADGRQPMVSASGDVVLSFNGEIFNAPELREQCERRGYRFQTDHSDTEVVLALYELDGERCLQALNGMFAFVLHDMRRGRLFGARDRFGIKPLYLASVSGGLAWASELKALLAVPGVEREIDRQSLFHYLSLRFVPGPRSILRGVDRLPPGHFFTYDLGSRALAVERWYRLHFAADRALNAREWAERVREDLRSACHRWTLSDVPIALSLSGGLDSSAIAALLADYPLRTFSLGFRSEEDAELDELPLARALADRYGFEHREIVVEADELLGDLLRMVWALDEPYGGGLPSWYVFRWMAEEVKVGVTGSGGDELFGNYRRFVPFETSRLGFLRRADVRRYHFEPSYYFTDREKSELLHEGAFASTAALLQQVWDGYDIGHTRDGVLALDLETQLPDEFLHMADRFSMAHSLEARTPFLDHVFVETVASIPPEMRTSQDDPKGLLRAAVGDLLTPRHREAPKRPFVFPLARWLRGELRPLAEHLLGDDHLRRQGIFRPGVAARLLDPHVRGERDESERLWPILMFQLWHLLYVEEELVAAPTFSWSDIARATASSSR